MERVGQTDNRRVEPTPKHVAVVGEVGGAEPLCQPSTPLRVELGHRGDRGAGMSRERNRVALARDACAYDPDPHTSVTHPPCLSQVGRSRVERRP